MPTPTISTRVRRIERIADAYCSISGDDPQDIATDILSDLQHWCAARGVRFAAALLHAKAHVAAEVLEQGRRA
jgi:hypothetical protein